jgi:hypothetical protein
MNRGATPQTQSCELDDSPLLPVVPTLIVTNSNKTAQQKCKLKRFKKADNPIIGILVAVPLRIFLLILIVAGLLMLGFVLGKWVALYFFTNMGHKKQLQ